MSKYALIDQASGLVKQWQDEALYGYAPAQAGEARVQLEDAFPFPDAPHWWDGAGFVSADPKLTPDVLLTQAQAARVSVVTQACAAAIVGGFASSALGAAHTYPSKMTDQQNLMASVLDAFMNAAVDGWTTPFWCEDASGAWAWVPHTAAQIRQVGQDGKAAVLAAQSKAASLLAQIAAATTVDAVHAIAW